MMRSFFTQLAKQAHDHFFASILIMAKFQVKAFYGQALKQSVYKLHLI